MQLKNFTRKFKSTLNRTFPYTHKDQLTNSDTQRLFGEEKIKEKYKPRKYINIHGFEHSLIHTNTL